MRGLSRALLSTLSLATAGCQWVGGYEDFSEASPVGAHACDPLLDRKVEAAGVLVRVDVPGASCAWIDQDETTVAQYERWRADPLTAQTQWHEEFCAWKTRASDPVGDPADSCAQVAAATEYQPFAADKPIRCVDWCDAEAYCRAAGKRLCYDQSMFGTQAPRGVPREWWYACNNSLQSVYPWGLEARDHICNVDQAQDMLRAERGPFPASSRVGCVSERGTRDLLGNVSEWTMGCALRSPSGGEATPCLTRGGAFDEALQVCADEQTRPNDTRSENLGFRCCADLSADERLALTPQ